MKGPHMVKSKKSTKSLHPILFSPMNGSYISHQKRRLGFVTLTVKTGLFFHFCPSNSSFTDSRHVNLIFGKKSVCEITQIRLCYYTKTIFPYQNTNYFGSTLLNALILPQYIAGTWAVQVAQQRQPVCKGGGTKSSVAK